MTAVRYPINRRTMLPLMVSVNELLFCLDYSINILLLTDPAEVRGDSSQMTDNSQQPTETQQIQAISASDAGPSGIQQNQAWRNASGQAQPTTQPQTPTQQTAQQQSQMIYEESGDGIVPSTPTLYVPRRADGFSEAVSSPQPQVCILTSFVSNCIEFNFVQITWKFVSF